MTFDIIGHSNQYCIPNSMFLYLYEIVHVIHVTIVMTASYGLNLPMTALFVIDNADPERYYPTPFLGTPMPAFARCSLGGAWHSR